MHITQIETIRVGEFPNILWVRLHTDEGLTGLGETFVGAAAVETHLHDFAPSRLIGKDPSQIEELTRQMRGYLGWRGSGVETRAASAVNIALWDLAGKALGVPVHQLLGGKARNSIRAYNTCAGPMYARGGKSLKSDNWGVGASGRYEDLALAQADAGELALSLIEEQGITGMKIWPFDPAAEASNGSYISGADLRKALEPFEKIRAAVGDAMDIMVEFHSLWDVPSAIRIARALEPYDSFWHEDPIRIDSMSSLAAYADKSRAPVCASETLGSRWGFRDLLEAGVHGVVNVDLSWCGGISEAARIAAMAETWDCPFTAHDCTGPVVLTASTHLTCVAPNALVQEMVRAYYYEWYPQLVTALPVLKDGALSPPDGPGLGLELLPDLHKRADATVRISDAA